MVADIHENGNSKPSGIASEKGADILAMSTRLSSPTAPKARTAPLPGIRKQPRKSGTIRAGYSPGPGLVAKQYKKTV